MFQLWGIVLLCGLLTGTSASLLDNDAVRELQSALKKGLEIDDSAFESGLEKVKADFESVRDFTCLEIVTVKEVLTEKIQEAEVLDKDNTENLQLFVKCLRLTIRSISIGNITFQVTPGGINLSISITAEVTLTLPLLGAVVDLTLNFVLQTSISFKIDECGTLMVVMGECTYTPAKISLPFVNSIQPGTMLSVIITSMSTFCLPVLPLTETGVLTSPAITVNFACFTIQLYLLLVLHLSLCPQPGLVPGIWRGTAQAVVSE
ncbi:hypothetical protein FD754_022811 [Muntiacus muntjak]|uniref:Lipid-binding serum glycoprotein N-terminal domain-containing protein n=1 Tax=Muntiacus muntjak TaxID=9888 RepID=A0A5N3UW88_MUNMU|nr:hypothetical protein FD754_022820 [Muntiacus muntjak]KAB0340803.1 hypothetical protein FD754_022817 [Muntiacus muntjak]KAB0340804.1 hypothetical protein FD754_022812 [Muntiacus muntjak]KAB0340809.1 hypothetical protein FD754_022811 [Muntiacus muntjak]